MITPLSAPDTLDIEGLERLIEHILSGGVHGLFILGSTGEGPALSVRLRRELITRVARQVGDRVPLLVGAIDTSYAEILSTASFAADAGADAIVVGPPYYLPLSPADLVRYIRQLSASCPLPVYLYNVPFLNLPQFSVEALEQCFRLPGIAGFKDSSGNFSQIEQLLKIFAERPDFTVLVGPEGLFARSMARGGHGCVAGGANVFPELLVALYDACVEHREGDIQVLQNLLDRFRLEIYTIGEPESGCLRGIKGALSALGICQGAVTDPYVPFTPVEQAELDRRLQEFQIELAAHLPRLAVPSAAQ